MIFLSEKEEVAEDRILYDCAKTQCIDPTNYQCELEIDLWQDYRGETRKRIVWDFSEVWNSDNEEIKNELVYQLSFDFFSYNY